MINRKNFCAFVLIVFGMSCIIGIARARKSVDIQNAFKPNVVHMCIIGSGPAGWSAAIYGARFGRKVSVIAGPKPGGLLTETSEVENWPGHMSILGSALINDFKQHALSLGVQCVEDSIESVDFSSWPFALHTERGVTINALSVIIATGGSPLKLGVIGEDTYWGRGVTSCAKCDAPFYKGEEVVVVGGGDSAIEEAIQLAPYAQKITLLVRKDHLRATKIMQERLLQYPSISVMFNVEVKEIVGDANQVTAVMLWNNKEQTLTPMPTNGVFLAIGHKPNTDIFASALKLDREGYIKMLEGRTQKTSIPGIFAAGDVEDRHYRQAIVAAGRGVQAAIDAEEFLTDSGLTPQVALQLNPYLFTDNAPMISIHQITSVQEFDALIATGKLVVVDFFTNDCPQCIEFEPIFTAVAQDYKNNAVSIDFIKVNAQDLMALSERFYIYKVPCTIIFKNGDIIARYGGKMGKDELKDALNTSLKSS